MRFFTSFMLSVVMLVLPLSAVADTGGPYLFVFNMGSEDVTVIDAATNQVLGTRPVGFKVKWLADEMRSFDGTLLWTYGLRGDKVDVIAFDPVALRVVKRQEVGKGPAHSVVLTSDRKQVLMNVVLNAIQACPGHGSVEVRTGDDGAGNCVVDVEDTGVGMTPEPREHIFDPFYTTKEQGSGLGLYIAHRIVSDHGGSIVVTPRAPAGTIFRITFRASEDRGRGPDA